MGSTFSVVIEECAVLVDRNFHPASLLTSKWWGTFHTVSPLTSKWGGLSIQCPPSLRSGGGLSTQCPPSLRSGEDFLYSFVYLKKSPLSKVGGTFHSVPPSFKVGGDKVSSSQVALLYCRRSGAILVSS